MNNCKSSQDAEPAAVSADLASAGEGGAEESGNTAALVDDSVPKTDEKLSSPAAVAGAAGAGVAAAIQPRRVLVIDDELHGMSFAHLRESAADFVADIEDLTSPTTEAVWSYIHKHGGAKPFENNDVEFIQEYLSSDAFVREVILSQNFRGANVAGTESLRGFYERSDSVGVLRAHIEAAYPLPHFSIDFRNTRPAAHRELLAYDLVLLDLVLTNSADAVDELVKYLHNLGNSAYPEKLPPLIVLSSREEMVDQRLRFSTESFISAAGLLLLEKRHVRLAEFGAAGLRLCYQQLNKQRDVAQGMRVFIREWTSALDAAKIQASRTLWNLDAAAMQEIHLSASRDDDPYDEHLTELVAREYIWHVEGTARVVEAIEALDDSFRSCLHSPSGKLVIRDRFMTPQVDSKPGRDVVSHYNWTGFAIPTVFSKVSKETLRNSFNRLVPFGAVLAPDEITNGTHCWIHITQQCDLNGAVRTKQADQSLDSTQSATFCIAKAVEVHDRSVPKHDNGDLVARGLAFGGKEYDLKWEKGTLISMPVSDFVDFAVKSERRVAGRLRHDIASQFLTATSNHMTRPASLKTTRLEVWPAQFYLWGEGAPGNRPIAFLDRDGKKVRQVMVSRHNGENVFLQDDNCVWLGLWIGEKLKAHFNQSVDLEKVCNTLSVGVGKGQLVVGNVTLAIEECMFGSLPGFWKGRAAPKGKVCLYMISEPAS